MPKRNTIVGGLLVMVAFAVLGQGCCGPQHPRTPRRSRTPGRRHRRRHRRRTNHARGSVAARDRLGDVARREAHSWPVQTAPKFCVLDGAAFWPTWLIHAPPKRRPSGAEVAYYPRLSREALKMGELEIGMVGLGVMGQNLALNIDEKGFSCAGWDAWPEPVDKFVAKGQREGRSTSRASRSSRTSSLRSAGRAASSCS